MATGARSSSRVEEQMAALIQRMDEQNQQLTEHLSSHVDGAEKDQQQMMSALREVEASLFEKQEQLRESILQEVATGDRMWEGAHKWTNSSHN